MKVYIDGDYFEKADARVSVFDHGLLYGDGVFEGIRIYRGRAFKLAEHIDRLYRSANALLIDIPLGKEEMGGAVRETLDRNGKQEGYVRIVVTRGEGSLGIDPASCRRPSIIIIVDDIHLYPERHYETGIGIITAPSRRISSDCLDPRIKSLNYLNNVLAKLEAKQAGCLEAVMLNREGFVAECTADNIFIVSGGRLLRPAPYHGALDGITMKTVEEIALSLGIRTYETSLTRYDLYTSEECFMTGTGAEIMPVVRIDGRVLGSGAPGVITRKLIQGFREMVAS